MRSFASTLVALGGAAALVLQTATPAAACGGFFCNAVSLSPIYQAGERILFAQDDGLVTMHIEVTYQGDPTEFAWLLPLPQVPQDTDGNPLPLDKAVQVSAQRIFSILQATTDPIFQVSNTFAANYCGDDMAFPSSAAFADGADDSGDDTGGAESGPVQVLQEAKVGPYDAQLIQATESDELFEWLNDNGYYQDPAAKDLLQYYADIDFVFVGIKLQSGKATEDLRPLALTFAEGAPCVPLRLTSIAATPDMPILVWVAGPGRAIPKNFIHAVVNDQAIQFPGGTNYIEVVTEAVESVTGRAWVTEYAQPADALAGLFLPGASNNDLASATTLSEVLETTMNMGLFNDADLQQILRAEVPMPEGLEGYPYGECWNAIPWDGCADEGERHETTEDEFYTYLDWWASQAEDGRLEIDVDVEALVARIDQELVTPLASVDSLMAEDGMWLTRFFTTMDPEAMTRDPLFAFNDELPAVDGDHTVETITYSDLNCDPFLVATYGDGSRYTHPCDGTCGFNQPNVPPVEGAPALLVAEVIDETGLPQPFVPTQASEVDGMLANAFPGTPTVPEDFELEEPTTPVNPEWPNPVDTDETDGCSGTPGGAPSPLAALVLLGLAALGLRRRTA